MYLSILIKTIIIIIIIIILTKDRFCLNYFELCNLMRVARKQHILPIQL